MRSNLSLVSVLTVLSFAGFVCQGCGGGGSSPSDAGSDADATSPDDGSTNGTDVSIFDVQGALPVGGDPIDVRGVVVTAIDQYGGRVGSFWVAEPAGGAFSGVRVFGADAAQVALLSIGDLVDIEGAVKEEYALASDTSGRTLTELVAPQGGAMTVTKVGTGTVPAPVAVDALAIGSMTDAAARELEWEKWEGVLVSVSNASVLGPVGQIGSTDTTFLRFPITGPLDVVSDLAAPIDPVTPGDCLASVTGILDYFFVWQLLHRETSAISTGGTACAAPEAGATLCQNGVDDEADGLVDCDDESCASVPLCYAATTIADIQSGIVATGSGVTLTEKVVTAITANGLHLFVADSPISAVNQGIYVFRGAGAAALPGTIVIGSTVTVRGHVVEFDAGPNAVDSLTEIDASGADEGVTFVAGPGAAPTPLTGIGIATLVGPSTAEPYESVLVRLTNVTVVAESSNRVTLDDGIGGSIVMEDNAFGYVTVPVGTCFTALTGVMTVNTFLDVREIWPRSAADMVVGVSCN